MRLNKKPRLSGAFYYEIFVKQEYYQEVFGHYLLSFSLPANTFLNLSSLGFTTNTQ